MAVGEYEFSDWFNRQISFAHIWEKTSEVFKTSEVCLCQLFHPCFIQSVPPRNKQHFPILVAEYK
jgi:hypothetical protein